MPPEPDHIWPNSLDDRLGALSSQQRLPFSGRLPSSAESTQHTTNTTTTTTTTTTTRAPSATSAVTAATAVTAINTISASQSNANQLDTSTSTSTPTDHPDNLRPALPPPPTLPASLPPPYLEQSPPPEPFLPFLPPLRAHPSFPLFSASAAPSTSALPPALPPIIPPINPSTHPSASSDVRQPQQLRPSLQPPSSLSNLISTLDEIDHTLDNANSHLRSLLDLSTAVDSSLVNPSLINSSRANASLMDQLSRIPSFSSPANMPRLNLHSAGSRRESSTVPEENTANRRAKRRRLDADGKSTTTVYPSAALIAPSYKSFHYGRYGQVCPGNLTMEIVSCDGGLYSDGGSYSAENILKNDNSVYCTKGGHCNIVLQHQGNTTFTLQELTITAPGINYSAPVREGLVFFSMSRDKLFTSDQVPPELMAMPTTHNSRIRITYAALFNGHQPAAPAAPAAPTAPAAPAAPAAPTAPEATRVARSRLASTLSNSDYFDYFRPGDQVNVLSGTTSVPAGFHNLVPGNYNGQDPYYRPRRNAFGPAGFTNQFQALYECSDDENDEAPNRPGQPEAPGGGGGNDNDNESFAWRARQESWQRGVTSSWSPVPSNNRSRHRTLDYDDTAYQASPLNWDGLRPGMPGYRARDYDDGDENDYTDLYELQDATSPTNLPGEDDIDEFPVPLEGGPYPRRRRSGRRVVIRDNRWNGDDADEEDENDDNYIDEEDDDDYDDDYEVDDHDEGEADDDMDAENENGGVFYDHGASPPPLQPLPSMALEGGGRRYRQRGGIGTRIRNNMQADAANSNPAWEPPVVKFKMEHDRTKCTIHFNPPLTTRYVLLKMWNPGLDMGVNIDIQGVVAKGFAGPRYFPSLDLR